MTRFAQNFSTIAILTIMLLAVSGCNFRFVNGGNRELDYVPKPINLLLPKTTSIHPFTQISNQQNNLEVYITAKDAYSDPTKAFGDFRFELYEFQPYTKDQKGTRLSQWEISLSEPEENATHWDKHTRSYKFQLGGVNLTKKKYVLVAVFSSKFTHRITCQSVISEEE